MMVFAWVMLVVMILGYGTANFLQGVAATKGKADERLDPRLLVRLARQKVYLCGVAFQALGMLTAIIARRDLPLFLVQAAIGAGIAITALLGVVIYRWRLARAEILLMVVIAVGLAALIFSANPSSPKSPNGITLIVMGALVFVFAGAANFAARLHGSGGSVVLGALGGLAFGASAIATRPLVNADSLKDFLTDPLLYIFIAHTIAGQLIFGLALQRGATTAASAAMNAMAAPVAVVGLLLLGDKIVEGRQFLAAIGFVATVSAVIGLAFYAQPQKHEG
ncbi:MAG: hypothetical protein ACRDQZ_01375, partial [Mycobacteriales bacterium]